MCTVSNKYVGYKWKKSLVDKLGIFIYISVRFLKKYNHE